MGSRHTTHLGNEWCGLKPPSPSPFFVSESGTKMNLNYALTQQLHWTKALPIVRVSDIFPSTGLWVPVHVLTDE